MSPTTNLSEDEAWHLLAHLPDAGPRTLARLIAAHGGPVGALRAVCEGRAKPIVPPPLPLPEWRRRAAQPIRRARRAGALVLTPSSRGYPALLGELPDPPAVLYVRGSLPRAAAIAVVGSRECSRYGERAARSIAAGLAAAGFTVVSGLARGIDAAAHRGALEAGGTTVAVLPCGIDSVYPKRHRGLARRIVRQGALISDFPPGSPVGPWCFPARNRIIAGLAWVTVVVEAAARSGAQITAGLAADYGREVMVVPGPITSPTSRGANALLSEGAHLCSGWRSILEHVPPQVAAPARARLGRRPPAPDAAGLGEAERRCLEALPSSGACSIEELAARAPLDPPGLMAAMTSLEVRGLVRSVGGGAWERS